jgi:hypothetical protein
MQTSYHALGKAKIGELIEGYYQAFFGSLSEAEGVCWAGPVGASMGATVTGCSSLTAGITAAGNRPGVSPVTGSSVDDEVVNMVIPPMTSTSAALAARATTAPGVPTTSPAPRLAHRRAPRAYPDGRAGAESSSPS